MIILGFTFTAWFSNNKNIPDIFEPRLMNVSRKEHDDFVIGDYFNYLTFPDFKISITDKSYPFKTASYWWSWRYTAEERLHYFHSYKKAPYTDYVLLLESLP